MKYENLLERFLILSPTKTGTSEKIMKDLWMNVGHEDELKPIWSYCLTIMTPRGLS